MIRQRNRQTALFYFGGDLVSWLVAFLAAWYLRFEMLPAPKGLPGLDRYLQLLPFVLLVWPIVYYFHGLYRIRRGSSRIEEMFSLVVAQTLAILILAGITAFYRPSLAPGSQDPFTFSRGFLLIFFFAGLVTVTFSRSVIRSVLRSMRLRGHNLRRILVVGAGELGREIADKIRGHRELGFEVVGFVDNGPAVEGGAPLSLPVLGPIDEIAQIIEAQRIDQVMIALPLEAHREILSTLDRIGHECVEVRLVPDILQYATLRATLEDLDGTPMINLSQVPLEGWQSLAKRVMDLGIATAAALVFIPLLPIVAIAIWWEDRGPIFYRQERMGLDGRPFMILKFRSMRVDAEKTTGPIWAVEDDPRRTRVGSLLRRTSIDELPQLWNVIKGEMSIVGPRPERPSFVSQFKRKIPHYMLRHRVKSGITGWAQVHGWRGNTSIKTRIQYDLYYIENWSLGLDVKILWMTFRQGLLKNAY